MFTTAIDTKEPALPKRAHKLPSQCFPSSTNKFYTNLLLPNQNCSAWPHPYTVWWSQTAPFEGFGLSQCTNSQKVFGPDDKRDKPQFYLNPIGIMSMNFGAMELSNVKASLACKNQGPLFVELELSINQSKLVMPIAPGMGFCTALYQQMTPVLHSQVGIKSFSECGQLNNGLLKYKVTLFNEVTWLLYSQCHFKQQDNNHIVSLDGQSSNCLVQLAALSNGGKGEGVYDAAAGKYVRSVTVDGNENGQYSISHEGAGVIFAAPHHVEAMDASLASSKTDVTLDSTTLGTLVGYSTDRLVMQEQTFDVGYLQSSGNENLDSVDSAFSEDLKSSIRNAAQADLDANMPTDVGSMYFSGKALDRVAYIALVCRYILKDSALTKRALDTLKQGMAVFVENRQSTPLAYDQTFGGVISTKGLDGDPGEDFGNSYYNDHHFHYGYFFHAAAVLGEMDPSWIEDQKNKDWINMLARDVANPTTNDKWFPEWRSFDWYAGHSWAKGLFESGDGRDEESSSEDYHAAYGLYLWGKTIQDSNLAGRSKLMLAVLKRSINHYMLFANDNKTVPPQMIANKVSGITFENKIDYATYFGLNPEYIHGIHMIPLTPMSEHVRTKQFVHEEWNQVIAPIIGSVQDGWLGILKMNQALIDANSALAFFADKSFSRAHLDGGMSHCYSIVYCNLRKVQDGC